jgi:hypothetical protein
MPCSRNFGEQLRSSKRRANIELDIDEFVWLVGGHRTRGRGTFWGGCRDRQREGWGGLKGAPDSVKSGCNRISEPLFVILATHKLTARDGEQM